MFSAIDEICYTVYDLRRISKENINEYKYSITRPGDKNAFEVKI